jgi:hypothetical protein
VAADHIGEIADELREWGYDSNEWIRVTNCLFQSIQELNVVLFLNVIHIP